MLKQQHHKRAATHPYAKKNKKSPKPTHQQAVAMMSSKSTLHNTLHDPSIAKHIPAPLKVKGNTTYKGNDLNNHESAERLPADAAAAEHYGFFETNDIYDQLQGDKHKHHNVQKMAKRSEHSVDDDLVGGGDDDHEQEYNAQVNTLKSRLVHNPNMVYSNLIKVLLPADHVLDEYSYLRIKKMATLNPDLLEMNENKLHQRLQQLSQIVLHPDFYTNYAQRHVYKKHNIPQEPPAHSLVSPQLDAYLLNKKSELAQGINNNDDEFEKQHRAYKKLHQSPYHPMVTHVLERFPLILRRKNIHTTPQIISEIFSTLNYSTDGDDIVDGESYQAHVARESKLLKDNGAPKINPHAILGKYPSLLTLDLTNKIHEKIDQFTSHLLNFLTSHGNQSGGDQRFTNQEIQHCHQAALKIILEQPDILHSNITALIPKRLQFIHQSVLLPTARDTLNEVILANPRLLSPNLKSSHLQRLALLRLKPPRFDHITAHDLQGLGYEADFALDMIAKLQQKLPHNYPQFTAFPAGKRRGKVTKALTLEELNAMEQVFDEYDQCWAQLLGSVAEKNETIKILTLMHQKTFHLLFNEFSTARKVANDAKQSIRVQKKFERDNKNKMTPQEMFSAAPGEDHDDEYSSDGMDGDDATIRQMKTMDATKFNYTEFKSEIKQNSLDHAQEEHFVPVYNTSAHSLDGERDKMPIIHSTPTRELGQEKHITHHSKFNTTISPIDNESFSKAEAKVAGRDDAKAREVRYKGKGHLLNHNGDLAEEEPHVQDDNDDPENVELGVKLTRKQHGTILKQLETAGDEDTEENRHLRQYVHQKKLQKFEKQKLQREALQEERQIQDEVKFYEGNNARSDLEGDIDDVVFDANTTKKAQQVVQQHQDGGMYYADLDVDNMFSQDEEETSATATSSGEMTLEQAKLQLLKEKKLKKMQKGYKMQSSEYETKWRGGSQFDRPNM